MLAGSMKLRHFLLLGLAGVGGLAAIAVFLIVRPGPDAPVVASPAPGAPAAPTSAPTSAPAGDLTPVILAHFKDEIPVDKVKDITPDKHYKLNLYKDPGHTTVNRIKLDLDRDEKWDEKYSADNGTITREVAPADDEEYTQRYRWDGSSWVSESAPPATPVAATGGREVDTVVLGYQGKNIGSDKLKDVTPGKPYKVNVYQDAGSGSANRAKIDLDRDDKWDEKITFASDGVSREVAPADDEVYSESYRWDGKAWAKAK